MINPEVVFIEVTPEKALQYLANAIPNSRVLDDNLVNYYSWKMRQGRWVATWGRPLTFYLRASDKIDPKTNWQFHTGQHRLHAVVKADTKVVFPAKFYPSAPEVIREAELECRKFIPPEYR